MALTTTSLSAALSANAVVLSATSATGATVGGFAKVDGEFMVITAINGTSISVRSRGDQGTAAVAHAVLSPLVFGLASDLAQMLGPSEVVLPVFDQYDMATIGANGAIAVPSRQTVFLITKATALGTSTLANPTKDQTGLILTFTSTTAAAHVVTLVTSQDGTTGNSTTYTFAAFAGCSFSVIATNASWNVLFLNGVTVT
jgi:hypothetical protein